MSFFFPLFFFVLGAIIGSFLNVVVLRYGTKTFGGRSCCFSCGKTLRWFELIPVVSFLLQKGRCRGCRARISPQYPLVELLTGLVFAAVAWKESFILSLYLLSSLLLWSLLIAISAYDFRHKIIPDKLLYGALLISFFLFLYSYFILHTSYFFDFWVGFLFAVPFALLWFFSGGRAMGLGDAKLALLFSWVVGFSRGLSALIVGFWMGAAVALLCLLCKTVLPFLPHAVFSRHRSWIKNLGPKTELPLGPFLVLGLFIVYFFDIDVTGLGLLLTN